MAILRIVLLLYVCCCSAMGIQHKRPRLRDVYLKTVRDSVSGTLLMTDSLVPGVGDAKTLERRPYQHEARAAGEDWPDLAQSMVGHHRLNNIRTLLENCMHQGIPGDFVECGVWRGGASIFAKAVLTASNAQDRKVVLVDSFMGLPEKTHHLDRDEFSKMDYLRVPKETVAASFERYGLLDNDVVFIKGFFNESAPELSKWLTSNKRTIGVLRLDGDMYVSLMDCLQSLYEHVSPGGYVIIDDWQLPEAVQAVKDYRAAHSITALITPIDHWSVYWQKPRKV